MVFVYASIDTFNLSPFALGVLFKLASDRRWGLAAPKSRDLFGFMSREKLFFLSLLLGGFRYTLVC